MKYNFYTIRDNCKADPRYQLPVDINEPIKEFLRRIDCEDAILWIATMENRLGWGRLEIQKKGLPVRLCLSSEYGMVCGYDQFEEVDVPKWHFTRYQHVKNKNIERKQKEVK